MATASALAKHTHKTLKEEAAGATGVALEATRVAVPGKLRLCHRHR